ncbi:UNVERIFIED_CONTAM: hypothetical protein Scaly_3099900 [Sesamum calycinum]|uniref:RNase H type-1 domain-containing protein n=1 Tax=Sesamum calycinum TaxID=2727403 RepID=A0AAW2JM64_9LAMI
MSAEWELSDDLPDENILMIEVTPSWKMYFDGVSHKERTGSGVVFVISEGEVLPYSFTLTQNCLNNVVEYQALILGLEITVDSNQLPLKVYGDSQLVVNQLVGLYEAKMLDLLPYYKYAKKLMGWLGDVELKHLLRKDNKQADALAKLVSTLSMTDKEKVVAKLKRDWHERIGEALWAYKTTIRTPTQATPYALIYGVETVLPLEQQIPSLRIAIQEELTEKKMLKYDLKN